MARQALGRGLEMLIPLGPPDADESAEEPLPDEAGVVEVPLDAIVPNPYQPRAHFAQQELEELTESIRLHGVLQPLVVRPAETGYQCVVGERRLRASAAAGLTSVPALIRDFSDQEMLELALVENAQREDLSPLESAVAYKRLIDEFGVTQAQVAEAIGKSRAAIANTIRLLDLPPSLQEALAANELTEGHARALLTVGEAEKMLALWDRLASTEVSVRETERLARAMRDGMEASATSRKPKSEPELDPNLASFVERLQRRLGTKVTMKPKRAGGTMVIEYYSDDDLQRISDVLLGMSDSELD